MPSFSDYPIKKIEKSEFSKYPLLERFLEIPDFPKQIYYRGELPTLDYKFLAVVGSRNITEYGIRSIKTLIEGLKGTQVCVISGLALGADAEAHVQALNNNLVTIAVPGSGLDDKVIYPKTNKLLALDILTSGGCLLSELPPSHESAVWTFPQRNRIMAALSDAVLLIEASEKSGTMITARLATEYNKDVLCVPGPIDSENSKGTNRLISNGARLVQTSEDILDELKIRITTVEATLF